MSAWLTGKVRFPCSTGAELPDCNVSAIKPSADAGPPKRCSQKSLAADMVFNLELNIDHSKRRARWVDWIKFSCSCFPNKISVYFLWASLLLFGRYYSREHESSKSFYLDLTSRFEEEQACMCSPKRLKEEYNDMHSSTMTPERSS